MSVLNPVRGRFQVDGLGYRAGKVAAGGGGIVRVQTNNNVADNSATNVLATLSEVTSGTLIVFAASKTSPSDVFQVGDLTKTAGTATIGTITLDVEVESAAEDEYSGVFSVPVTGSGTLTMTLGGMTAGTYSHAVIIEYSGADISGTRVAAVNSGTGTTGAPTSGDAASTGAAVFVGVVGFNGAGDITITEDGAFLLLDEEESGSAHQLSSVIEQIVGGATTDAASWTAPTSGQTWAASVVVYKAE